MEDYLTIEMPKFRPNYRRWKRYGWKRPKERENSKEVLLEAGRGYCMYCYTRIQVAGKYMGDLEHAIERRNSVLLEECIPNIGIAWRKKTAFRQGADLCVLRTGQVFRNGTQAMYGTL